ncbi:MAG TPA: PDZ domain-containing protein [Steroidobacteraceae bacterium]|jgi:S1-C subfamily serine protease|nr:PDZ domain-containing protein [Steroidobacteraceae bacterium]
MKNMTMRAPAKRSGQVAFGAASHLAALASIMLMLTPAFGAEQASPSQSSQSPPAPPAQASSLQPQRAALEAQLARARAQLEQAARQMAQLSVQLGAERANRVSVGQRLQRGVIGLQLDPASGHDGARVLEVSPGGPAADGGVRAGDLIVTVNGTTIAGDDTAEQVVGRLRRVPPNTPVRLQLRRGDKTLSIELTTQRAFLFAFASLPANGAVPPVPPEPAMPAMPAVPPVPPIPPLPPVPAPVLVVPPLPNLPYLQALTAETAGMELATLTPTLGRYFGTDEGVLVIRAPRDDAFQLQDGDVIVAIDGRKPLDGGHATRILASYQPGERITLKILRQKRPVSLTIKLPGDLSQSVPR